MSQVVVAIAGTIGSGKTTLTRKLADELGFAAVLEPHVSNPYLQDFYRDMSRFALPSQLYFLLARMQQTQTTLKTGASAVLDRTSFEDAEIFAAMQHDTGIMSARDYETYSMAASMLFASAVVPSLLIFVDRTLANCMAQIRRRGRDMEQGLDEAYLRELHLRYQAWFENYDRGPKLRWRADDYDIVEREDDWRKISKTIREALPQRLLF